MKTDELDYELPPDLIAQTPATPRDESRLLVVHGDTGRLEHRCFRDIGDYLRPGDTLVPNNSRVLPARLRAHKLPTGGSLEVLLLEREDEQTWQALVNPGRRVADGAVVEFERQQVFVCPTDEQAAGPSALRAEVLGRTAGGARRLRFSSAGADLERAFESFGETPLPPYIRQPLDDPERYQTVYASARGSVAAPTAGLHFTPQLLSRLQASGVGLEYVTVHIGLHTFRPIRAEEVEAHEIHRELCTVSEATAHAANSARAQGRRVVAVGTSSVRALESAWRDGAVHPYQGWSNLYIYPGYTYHAVDAMITNFHLPRTTLLALVAAFLTPELIRAAYAEAIRERYRFYSFGDACLLLHA
ncbi:MAG TPA: tRNA preQ1(34) S-adenosylmethionine ribosyltransferase-isomerase QueA [Chloroflexota bacterium]|nr:tRNA preQ1(34) S-adenosylmethionine ribosyltransferase-isomerase QueA [Chloroflexota bacterium]